MINNQSISQKRSGQNKMPERTVVHFIIEPGWRNWQTQRTQNPPGFRPWGLDSPSWHHSKNHRIRGLRWDSSPYDLPSAADAADFSPTSISPIQLKKLSLL